MHPPVLYCVRHSCAAAVSLPCSTAAKAAAPEKKQVLLVYSHSRFKSTGSRFGAELAPRVWGTVGPARLASASPALSKEWNAFVPQQSTFFSGHWLTTAVCARPCSRGCVPGVKDFHGKAAPIVLEPNMTIRDPDAGIICCGRAALTQWRLKTTAAFYSVSGFLPPVKQASLRRGKESCLSGPRHSHTQPLQFRGLGAFDCLASSYSPGTRHPRKILSLQPALVSHPLRRDSGAAHLKWAVFLSTSRG